MTIMKRNGNLLNPLPNLFEDFFNRDLFDWGYSNQSQTGTSIPAVNIRETNDHFEVEVAAPGMKKDDFKVELDNNVLSITSERKEEREEKEEGKFNRREFSYQSFQRSFHLAKEIVDADKIEANYQDGVLHLSIPKRDEVKPKPSRLITIN